MSYLKKSFLLSCLIIISGFILYQCKKSDLDGGSRKVNPLLSKHCGSGGYTFTGITDFDDHLDAIAQAFTWADYEVHKNEFREKVDLWASPVYEEVTIRYLENELLNFDPYKPGPWYLHEIFDEIFNDFMPSNNSYKKCAFDGVYTLNIPGGIPMDVHNLVYIPQRNDIDMANKLTMQLMVIPNRLYPDGIRGYVIEPGSATITLFTYADMDELDDEVLDRDDGATPYYVWIIDVEGKYESPGTYSCEEKFCGDYHCDEFCDETEETCPDDCNPFFKKRLLIKDITVLTDHKTNSFNYHESWLAAKYEIMYSAYIAHSNGISPERWGNILKVPRREIERCNQKKSPPKCKGNSTMQSYEDVVSRTFNPTTDVIYIMFWEADIPPAPYKSVNFKYKNQTGLAGVESMYSRAWGPPFGDKSNPQTDEEPGIWNHVIEIDPSVPGTFNLVGNKWVYTNPNALDYGLEFTLEYED